MSDFVYDDVAVPNGKVNANPLGVSANKGVTATEWNSVMQFLKDLRGAIINGQYSGLQNSDAAISALDKMVMRLSDGLVQVSVSAGDFRNLSDLHVADFGAKGDDTTDDGAALQSALDAAFTLKLPLQFDGKTYLTSAELDNAGVELKGKRGAAGTVIATNSSITSVMKITGVTKMKDFTIDGRHVATSALRLTDSSYSTFDNVRAYGGLKDGWLLDDSGGGNDACIFINCSAEFCGHVYRSSGRAVPSTGAPKTVVAGTVSTIAGNVNITGSGTTFTAMGIRPGDFIAIGANAAASEWIQIGKVVSDTVLQTGPLHAPAQTRSTQEFAVLVGDGYREKNFGDNNNNHLVHFHTLNVACCGASFAGIWGPRVDQFQSDASGAYPIRVGFADETGVQSAPIATKLEGLYAEGFTEIPQDGVVFIAAANGIVIDGVKTGLAGYAMPNASLGYGTIANVQSDPGAIRGIPAGGPVNYVLSSALYRATLTGELISTPIGVLLSSPAATLSTGHGMVAYLSGGGGGSVDVTATPSLTAGSEGQIMILSYTDTTGSVTLHDEASISGTKLKLATTTVALARRDSLMLVWIDGFWREVGRTIAGASFAGSNTGDVTLAAVGSSPAAEGASLSGQVLTLQPADGTNPGVMTAGTQTIGGAKTFASTVAASNLSGTNTGDVSLSAFGSSPDAKGATISGQAIALQPADATHPGAVSLSAQTMGAGTKTFEGVIASNAANDFAMLQANVNGAIVNFSPGDNYAYIKRSAADTLRVGNGTSGNGGFVVSGTLQCKYFFEMSDFADGTGTTGSQTLNVSHGKIKIGAGIQTIAITTNRLITNASVFATVETDDTTAQIKNITRSGTTFTIKLVAAATADTVIGFMIVVP